MALNQRLAASVERMAAHWRNDPRCEALFLWGSAGRGDADVHSDVDLGLVVRDEDYEAVRAELEAVCARVCGPLVAWLPEADAADFCSIAFLYEEDGHTLLWDLSATAHRARERTVPHPHVVLFDRDGVLPPPPVPVASAGRDLHREIVTYWVYAYLNGKYARRGDLFKLFYVQQTLFHLHLRLLTALHPEAAGNWWARDVHHLPDERQSDLQIYFGAGTQEAVFAALPIEFDRFSRDAHAVCARFDVDYPAALELAVRRHLFGDREAQAVVQGAGRPVGQEVP